MYSTQLFTAAEISLEINNFMRGDSTLITMSCQIVWFRSQNNTFSLKYLYNKHTAYKIWTVYHRRPQQNLWKCWKLLSRPSVIHSIMLINNALSRTNLCHTGTWLLKSLTAEVLVFLLFEVIIFLPHSTEGKVMHCCAWKAINVIHPECN